MHKPPLIILSILFSLLIPAVSAEDQPKLPAGRYIYLGTDQSSRPKHFTILPDGSIIWQSDPSPSQRPTPIAPDMIFRGNNRLTDPDAAGKIEGTPLPATGALNLQPLQSDPLPTRPGLKALAPLPTSSAPQRAPLARRRSPNIESADWPVIKFATKPIPGLKDAYAQLTTTFGKPGSSLQMVVRYKLILLHADPMQMEVQLLDADEFKLCQFSVYPSSFQPIPDTSLIVARGEFSMEPSAYLRIWDISLMPRSLPATRIDFSPPAPAHLR